ncbi:hypothetical protein VYU27_000652 [Nannochloropsis oceanica]
MARDSLLLWGAGLSTAALLYYIVIGLPDGSGKDDGDDDEPALSKRKLISLWSMLVKNMELHKYQIQQVLHQQRAQLAQQGTEVPDEHIVAMYKQNFEEILENVQVQILGHFEVTEEELEAATELYKDDPEVSALVVQLEGFYLGEGGATGGEGLEGDIGVEELEKFIVEEFGDAWCDAYEKTMREFQALGREPSEADQEVLLDFQSQASVRAQDNLTDLLQKYGLTSTDFQRLVLKHQADPRINQALQHSQTVQTEALAKMGLRV